MTLSIKKGDTVQVISGKDRGVKGKVIEVYPETSRIIACAIDALSRRQLRHSLFKAPCICR